MSHPPDDHEPINLHELRPIIRFRRGWRSLLRQLEAREVMAGVRWVVRKRGKRGTTRYWVTIALMREHAADLLPSELRAGAEGPADRDAIRSMRNHLHLLDDHIEEACIDLIERRVLPRLKKVEKDVAQLKLPGIAQ